MEAVGVRALKSHTSEILRRVREKGETVDITYHGEIIAHIIPVGQQSPNMTNDVEVWKELERLSAEISAKWPEGVSAADAVKEQRREL